MFVVGSTMPISAQDTNENAVTSVSNGANDSVQGYTGFAKFASLSSNDSEEFKLEASDITETSAKLSWNENNSGTAYSIYVLNPITQGYQLYTVSNSNTVSLKNLAANTTYQFTICVANSDVVLDGVSFTTKVRAPLLEISDTSSKSVKLKIKNATKNSKIELYRGTNAKNLKKIATLKNAGTYTDSKVKSKSKYYYKAKAVSSKEQASSKTVSTKTPVKMGLPSVSGKTKTYAYYTAVTVKSSPQYKLLNSKKCHTDPKTGIRMVDDCYCIALGSYYGTKIGTKYKITLSSGKSFNAILCDQKANRHTDSKHQYAVRNKDIVEFYVQKGKIPRGINGSYDKLDQFKGSIVSIEKYV